MSCQSYRLTTHVARLTVRWLGGGLGVYGEGGEVVYASIVALLHSVC